MIASLMLLWMASPFPEIVDAREIKAWWQNPKYGFTLVSTLWQRATGPQPPRLSDRFYFGSMEFAQGAYSFNCAYGYWLEAQEACNIDRDYSVLKREQYELRAIWDGICDAHQDFFYVWTRRMALQKAKDAMGPDWLKVTPPIAPLWRFRDVTDQ